MDRYVLGELRDALEIGYTVLLILVVLQDRNGAVLRALWWRWVARSLDGAGKALYRGSLWAQAEYWKAVRV